MAKNVKKACLGIATFATICIIVVILIVNNKENDTVTSIGDGASGFIEGINNAQSHLNEFSYNYETGEVEYKPNNITLEMYNRVTEGMGEKEVIQILGNGERKNGDNTYMITWGDLQMSKGYLIQIVFDENSKVLNKNQLGLK